MSGSQSKAPGFAGGYLLVGATFSQIEPSPWIGFAAGTALSLAMSCFGECLRLRRCQEAALLLLRQEGRGEG